MPLTPREWLLLVIGDGLDPIRIQKGLFLFAMESGAASSETYTFEPYNWGPFSAAIYGDLEALQADGLIERVPVPGESYYLYRQTARGQDRADQLVAKASRSLIDAVHACRSQVIAVEFNALLRRIYKDYPDYAKKSLFQQR